MNVRPAIGLCVLGLLVGCSGDKGTIPPVPVRDPPPVTMLLAQAPPNTEINAYDGYDPEHDRDEPLLHGYNSIGEPAFMCALMPTALSSTSPGAHKGTLNIVGTTATPPNPELEIVSGRLFIRGTCPVVRTRHMRISSPGSTFIVHYKVGDSDNDPDTDLSDIIHVIACYPSTVDVYEPETDTTWTINEGWCGKFRRRSLEPYEWYREKHEPVVTVSDWGGETPGVGYESYRACHMLAHRLGLISTSTESIPRELPGTLPEH